MSPTRKTRSTAGEHPPPTPPLITRHALVRASAERQRLRHLGARLNAAEDLFDRLAHQTNDTQSERSTTDRPWRQNMGVSRGKPAARKSRSSRASASRQTPSCAGTRESNVTSDAPGMAEANTEANVNDTGTAEANTEANVTSDALGTAEANT